MLSGLRSLIRANPHPSSPARPHTRNRLPYRGIDAQRAALAVASDGLRPNTGEARAALHPDVLAEVGSLLLLKPDAHHVGGLRASAGEVGAVYEQGAAREGTSLLLPLLEAMWHDVPARRPRMAEVHARLKEVQLALGPAQVEQNLV